MKIYVLSILLIFNTCIFGQVKTKKIKIENHEEGYIETFKMIKPENKIKHGIYKKSYHGKPAIIGQYDNDKKVGLWKFYDYDGTVNLEYNFSENKVINFPKTDEKKLIITNTDTIYDDIEQQVLLFGSKWDMAIFIGKNIKYPSYALQNKLIGLIYVGIVIDFDGTVKDYYIINGAHEILNKEALRVIKLYNCKFLPAIKEGRAIKSVYVVPIKFFLS